MKSANKNSKSIFKKIVKFFLWSSLIFFILVIIAAIVIRVKYPPSEIKKIIELQASKALNNRSVKIGYASLNPFKGFLFDDIIVYEPFPADTSLADSLVFFYVKKAYVKYKLSSLFKRTLKINEIVIDHPQIHLTSNRNGQTNIDDLVQPGIGDTVLVAHTDTAKSSKAINLPVSFELDRFDFENFDAFLSYQSDSADIEANIHNFSIFIKELIIPKGSLDQIKQNAKIQLTFKSPKSDWKFNVNTVSLKNPFELHTQFDMNVDLAMNGIGDIKLNGKTSMDEVIYKESGHIANIPVSNILKLVFNLQIDGEKGNIFINQFVTGLADEDAFQIEGEALNVFDEPHLSLTVSDSKIRLSRLLNAFTPLVPSEYKPALNDLDLGGTLSFKDTGVHGNPLSNEIDEGLAFNTILNLKNLNATYQNPDIKIEHVDLNIYADGILFAEGLRESEVKAEIKVGSVFASPDDTLQLSLQGFHTNLFAEISDDYFPKKIIMKSAVEEIFNTSIHINFDFNSIYKLKKYDSHASLTLNNLYLEELPQSPAGGPVDLTFTLNSTSLEHIASNLYISTDSLYVPINDQELVIPPTLINSDLNIATDTTFQNFNVEQVKVHINDFLSIRGNASVHNMGEDGFHAVLDTILLKHRELFDYIPRSFKSGIENLKVTGNTFLTAKVDGKTATGQIPEISAQLNGKLNAEIEYPEIPLHIGSIVTSIRASSDSKTVTAGLSAIIDSLTLPDVRKEPINNTGISINCYLPDFEKVRLDSCLAIIPSLGSTLKFEGQVDSLSTNPEVTLDAEYIYSSKDSTLIVNDLLTNGDMNSKLHIRFQEPYVELNGEIGLDKLNIFLEDQIQIQQISGFVPFSQKADINQLTLINDKNVKTLETEISALNYNIMLPYYLQSTISHPHIYIHSLNIMGYEISDFLMDLQIGNGKIAVPRFTINLFEGNMHGNLLADFDTGEPDKFTYFLKANISQLNSAKLIPGKKVSEKDSELNMNMEFKGIGLDPTKNIDFGGFLYVTKIGNHFLDNMLDSFDPKGTDKSIRDTKRLLNLGYKPSLISFEIKHGNMNPTIYLRKGSLKARLIPVNLSGGKIELSRIPTKFVIDRIMAEMN